MAGRSDDCDEVVVVRRRELEERQRAKGTLRGALIAGLEHETL